MSGVFEVVAFSETLAGVQSELDVGSAFYIRVNVQFDGDSPRLSAQELEPLTRASIGAAKGLTVVIGSEAPLGALRDLLTPARRGNGQVRVISRLDEGDEVEVELRDGYFVSPEIISAVRSVPGVIEVREI